MEAFWDPDNSRKDAGVEPRKDLARRVRQVGTVAQVVRPEAQVWRGSMLPTDRQGVKVLGTPLGHPHYVARHLQRIVEEHHTLLDRTPHLKDLQSALLLLHCASARANYQLRTVDPASTGDFSEAHDQDIWQCLCNILQIDPTQAQTVKDIASLPLVLGGLGLRSARRTRVPAHWASWADCIPMIRARHSTVAEQLVRQLEGHPAIICLHEAASAARSLDGVLGWSPPSWRALTDGERPDMRQPEESSLACHEGVGNTKRHLGWNNIAEM